MSRRNRRDARDRALPNGGKKPPNYVTDQEIMVAVEICEGNFMAAAMRLGITYNTMLNRAKRNPEIYDLRTDLMGDWVRIAEQNVYDELLKGSFAASKFVLERLAREKWGNQPAQVAPAAWPEPVGEHPDNMRGDDGDTDD